MPICAKATGLAEPDRAAEVAEMGQGGSGPDPGAGLESLNYWFAA